MKNEKIFQCERKSETTIDFGTFQRVENFNGVKNQFRLVFSKGELFQSYDTPIAARVGWKVYLFPAWNYSKTTAKHRGAFLGERTKETREKLAPRRPGP